MLKVTDKVSLNFIWEEDSIKEIKDKLYDKSFYVSPDNKLVFSAKTLTNDIVMKTFTE